MGMTYTDSYETRKAHSEVSVNDMNYVIDYIVKSPIDGKANEVNASFYQGADEKKRIGYGSYSGGASSVRFDSFHSVPIDAQKALNAQYMNDLAEILK